MVMHAVVSPELKEGIQRACAKAGAPVRDLTGGFVEFIAAHSAIRPDASTRRLHDTGDEYHQRIDALEFTLAHDDGLGLETLDEADIVLAGVSRTGKTPTSIYLAQQGFKVANVSLARAVAPPAQLLRLSSTVVGLLIDPERLQEIRSSRQAAWGMAQTSYSERDAVRDEVAWSRKLFMQKGWPTLDVTTSAVEETAAKVVELLKLVEK
jgi:regulator of PEP synthase PpsR (kinase-PPPase family)